LVFEAENNFHVCLGLLSLLQCLDELSVQPVGSSKLIRGNKSLFIAGTGDRRSIYTCTYGVVFFGTPHLGSSKAQLLGHLQKIVSIIVPKSLFRTETSLFKALKAGSEILQDIKEQFLTLKPNLSLVYLWEQERTMVKGFGNVYIVDQSSAAPAMHGVTSFGIAANHQGMCRFANSRASDFVAVAVEIRRYAQAAPAKIRRRCTQELEMLQIKRDGEVLELVGFIEGKQRVQTDVT
jgi:protein SERAC1